MKIHHVLEVFIIFAFLALPPLFVQPGGAESAVGAHAWPSVAASAVAAIFLCVRGFRYAEPRPCVWKGTPVRAGFMLFAALCVNSVIWNAVQAASHGVLPVQTVLAAENSGMFFILRLAAGIAVSAFYEETLYRLFLPEALRFLFSKRRLPVEAAVVVVFALGHRYLGAAAVLNAACAGVLLRVCTIKTGSVAAGTAAHIAYNTVQYALLLLGIRAG
ncbi:CPBP family glutamic-type intramembrane protease [Treponema brennaborense]|uniref:Abortive infection protein n=1 Tax=Treponema brennaborense (strain DSM 12168 / CIP 105900 / DD5/3) TaxID=906968 RepID=F4LM43_TREBD|nr:CPBP family intramembrane glutamic endopeptidase [Treponema brennaborense]AEE16722.1 Abortive infection protein [Treponema brennaborense DSM 12168]